MHYSDLYIQLFLLELKQQIMKHERGTEELGNFHPSAVKVLQCNRNTVGVDGDCQDVMANWVLSD